MKMDKVREMMKLMLLMCTILGANSMFSQGSSSKTLFTIRNNNTIEEQCASDHRHDKLMRDDAEYASKYQDMEREIRSVLDNGEGANRSQVLTVPLVVHVMHLGEPVGQGTNISDEQIHSAVTAMNEDFRKMPGTNGDGIGVDVEIEFCLAVRDPNGNPTSGINRVDASGVPNYATEGIEGDEFGADEQAIKSLSRWPKTDYYNIWVVSEINDNDGGSGTQGYAYFPAASAAVDGTVILYNAIGTVGNLKGYTNMNRTLTHELGHGLHLYHTFSGTCEEDDCTTEGDRVCDTPVTSNNSNCNSPACNGTQQVENYMDYTSQDCKNTFTAGQRDRMRAALMGTRASLLQSEGCIPVTSNDVGIVEIKNPLPLMCSGNFAPAVSIRNFGAGHVSSLNVQYSVDGGGFNTIPVNQNIASGETIDFDLPNLNLGIGAHSLVIRTSMPNGSNDDFQPNDSKTLAFEVVNGSTLTVDVQVDMYGSDNSWMLYDSDNNLVASDGPFPNNQMGTVFSKSVCVAAECYTFEFLDAYGDGMIASSNYSVTDSQQGEVAAGSGSAIGDGQTTTFCLNGGGGGSTVDPPVANFIASSDMMCLGGAINFMDMSSGAPTSWQWTFEGANIATSTSQNPGNVVFNTPGTHMVTLTVGNEGGTDTYSDVVTIGEGPIISGAVSHLSCYGNQDGAINLQVSGGMQPYNYSWSHGASTGNVNGLPAGIYNVVVTDGLGCESLQSFEVMEPIQLVVVTNSNMPDQNNAGVGSAQVSAQGGSIPYTYSWSNGQSGAQLTGVTAGNYTVTVTDANGCTATHQLVVTNQTVSENDPPTADFIVDQEMGCEGSTRSFINQCTGAPTSYQWEFEGGIPATSTEANPSGIRYDQEGTFKVVLTATNAFGIDVMEKLAYITVSSNPQITMFPENVTCFGNQDGVINMSVGGGSGQYTYAWSNGSGSQDISSLAAGTYSVVVTDVSGCTAEETVNIASPTALLLSQTGYIPDMCEEGVGSVTVVPSGGTPDYTIQWNDGAPTTDFTLANAIAGDYLAKVTDANGCEKFMDIVIEDDCDVNSIDEVALEERIQVYPNPSNGEMIYVQLEDINLMNIRMMDINGAEVPVQVFNQASNISVLTPNSNISNGMYWIQLSNENISLTKKVMVNR